MEKAVFATIDAMVQSIVAGVAEYDNLVADQCALLMQAAERLVSRLGSPDENSSGEERVEALHKGERAAAMIRNLDLLSRCPPLERHEWLRVVLALDALMGRIDDALEESEVMCVSGDPTIQAMTLLIHEASLTLTEGFSALGQHSRRLRSQIHPLTGLLDAMEMRYLRSMSSLLSPDHWQEETTPPMVLAMLKRWMIYRCLFDIQRHLVTARDALLALAAMRENRAPQKRISSHG
ncbi:MAG: hypothetical protein HQM00_06020 [Magnetococcales bacterium]|nr:hypothetical protein [Magnetococcales bacterium]